MSSAPQTDRTREKLAQVLEQVGAVGARFNLLAIQHWLFVTLALLIGACALTVGAAFLLSSLWFFIAGVIVAVALAIGLVRTVRVAWRMRVTQRRAASIADNRAGLKGRLATLVATAGGVGNASPLWPYLVEDTLELREEFAPARIEPRRLSRSIYALLAAFILAGLVAPLAFVNRPKRLATSASAARPNISVDIGNLRFRPADPALGSGVQLNGDPATLRKLARKMEQAERSARAAGPLSRFMNNARDLADSLQDKLTGRHPIRTPARLTVTDKNPRSGSENRPSEQRGKNSEQASNGSRNRGVSGNNLPFDSSRPNSDLGRFAANKPPSQSLFGAPARGMPGMNPSQEAAAGQQGQQTARAGGTSAHGSGTDPNHLFGRAEPAPVGNQSLKIAIDARLSDTGQSPGSPAYLPPRVHVSLNSHQYPDEPLARSSVPADDRMTVKRVFER